MTWEGLWDLDQYEIGFGNSPIVACGMSAPEGWGRWTCESEVKLSIPRSDLGRYDVAVIIELMPHIHSSKLKSQHVEISHMGVPVAKWELSDTWYRLRGFTIKKEFLLGRSQIDLNMTLPNAESPKELGVNDDERKLGIAIYRVWIASIPHESDLSVRINELGSRFVGVESRKTWDRKHLEGFWSRFAAGPKVLDIGFSSYGDARVVPILPGSIGVDIDYPGYDGRHLPFDDGSQDAVYSSHCLEHIADPLGIIQDWYRVTRIGGHIIIAVPSRDLYERRRRPPSLWNQEHLRMYSCASLLAEIESALEPNSFKVRYLSENDEMFDYSRSPEAPPYGNYEITVVIEKIATPEWRLID
ncbi:methyltransferase domain-containing protein [Brevundimonas aurantiaca]|uniref:methyltransferase domain-containing protein n=1 Tax=Brevundimonas aurantiaca TaxID=74316 RepID=UPI00301AB3BF